MSKRHASGFTLVEVLIALFIFVIISVLIIQGLGAMTKDYQAISRRQKFLQRLSLTVSLLRQDVSQMSSFQLSLSAGGDLSTILESLPNGFSFMRRGVINPFNLFRRSDFERVTYNLSGNQLTRMTSSIDPGAKPSIIQQTLLGNISNIAIRYVGRGGIETEHWPPPVSNANVAQQILPLAIKITLTLRSGMTFTMLLPINSWRSYAKP